MKRRQIKKKSIKMFFESLNQTFFHFLYLLIFFIFYCLKNSSKIYLIHMLNNDGHFLYTRFFFLILTIKIIQYVYSLTQRFGVFYGRGECVTNIQDFESISDEFFVDQQLFIWIFVLHISRNLYF